MFLNSFHRISTCVQIKGSFKFQVVKQQKHQVFVTLQPTVLSVLAFTGIKPTNHRTCSMWRECYYFSRFYLMNDVPNMFEMETQLFIIQHRKSERGSSKFKNQVKSHFRYLNTVNTDHH